MSKDDEKFTQKWAVASFFDNLPEGFEFQREETPLHATLAGVFSINLKGAAIADLLKLPLGNRSRFGIEGESVEKWGDGLRVTLLKFSNEFNELYRAIQKTLLDNGAVFNEPQYIGDGFRPHVTIQKHERLEPGSAKTIQNVSLVDMFPGGDGHRRRIHATLNLLDL